LCVANVKGEHITDVDVYSQESMNFSKLRRQHRDMMQVPNEGLANIRRHRPKQTTHIASDTTQVYFNPLALKLYI